MQPIAWSRSQPPVDAAFLAGAARWLRNSEAIMLQRVWQGFDLLDRTRPVFDGGDLERSITERLETCIQDNMSGDEPFTVQHGPHERETKQPPPAQPPQYDIAFVFRADPRVMWPLEAKVLETPRALAAYVGDVNDQFLTCRYAPFSPSGAMLGYLLTGSVADVFATLATRLACTLEPSTHRPERAERYSDHVRTVPQGKSYPSTFTCHHVIVSFEGVTRTASK
jgi:hypothetical protein